MYLILLAHPTRLERVTFAFGGITRRDVTVSTQASAATPLGSCPNMPTTRSRRNCVRPVMTMLSLMVSSTCTASRSLPASCCSRGCRLHNASAHLSGTIGYRVVNTLHPGLTVENKASINAKLLELDAKYSLDLARDGAGALSPCPQGNRAPMVLPHPGLPGKRRPSSQPVDDFRELLVCCHRAPPVKRGAGFWIDQAEPSSRTWQAR